MPWLDGPYFRRSELKQMRYASGSFVDLWTALGCFPECASILSEATTVAAAELAGAASRAADEAA